MGVHQTGEIWVRRGRRVTLRRACAKSGRPFRAMPRTLRDQPSAVMLRREIFDETAMFDETFPRVKTMRCG